MSVEVRRLPAADEGNEGDEAELRAFVDIVNAVSPESPSSIDEVRWADRTYPGGVRFLALLDGRRVGAASVGRIYVHEASFPRLWLGIRVLADARRRGLGTALWTAVSEVARDVGKTGLQCTLSEAELDGVAFLANRGFEVLERDKIVRRDLRGLVASAVDPPRGIVLTTLAERPDLDQSLHAVALEAYPDIPSVEPLAVGSPTEFLARDVRRSGIPAGAFTIALDEARGEVVGWASLMLAPGSTTLAWHDMTAVRRAWRGRGVASALKRATIAWAIANGLEALETGNDPDNAPMRAVNARLGYRPLPDRLMVRGPLAPEKA